MLQVQNWKCCHIKLWRIIKEWSISWAFNSICILVYCVLYTMTIDITWHYLKNNKKKIAFDLFTCIIFSACQFLHYFFKNDASCHVILQILYIYIYLKLKLRKEKHICLKWVFLPQWTNTAIADIAGNSAPISLETPLRYHQKLSAIATASADVSTSSTYVPTPSGDVSTSNANIVASNGECSWCSTMF